MIGFHVNNPVHKIKSSSLARPFKQCEAESHREECPETSQFCQSIQSYILGAGNKFDDENVDDNTIET